MFRAAVYTDGGIVLWDRSIGSGPQIPDGVFNEILLRKVIEASQDSGTLKGGFNFRLDRVASLGANVVLVYPSILRLKRADEVVSDIATIFASTSGPKVDLDADLAKFDALVSTRLQQLDLEPESELESEPEPESESESGPETKPGRDAEPEQARSLGKSSQTSKQKAISKAGKQPGASGKNSKKTAKKGKKKRRNWDGISDDEGDDDTLDYSAETTQQRTTATPNIEKLSLEGYGHKSRDGFMVSELTDELSGILSNKKSDASPAAGESLGFLRGFIGGKKLTEKDLDKALGAIEDHLVRKNVAKEVAHMICSRVRADLQGASTDSWTSVKSTVRTSVLQTLRNILTPSTSLDLLVEIQHNRSKKSRPYVISVVGVNGVGKSTNLGKLAFWLLQNDLRVLIAAADTFRSGAVEQLKVHVDRLKQLTERQSSGDVELFQSGYGKDAAVVAQKAVEYGASHNFDVVLIDTAGRRHNDERLMSSLERFGKLANPDKVVMVGEALVGTDSVEQARNFDSAFGPNRRIDFFLVSKCDTVGDMLGTLVNMTCSTGVPVLFVGVGQNYTDLRTLSVEWAVNLLLS